MFANYIRMEHFEQLYDRTDQPVIRPYRLSESLELNNIGHRIQKPIAH
jgi:hypothetical protein